MRARIILEASLVSSDDPPGATRTLPCLSTLFRGACATILSEASGARRDENKRTKDEKFRRPRYNGDIPTVIPYSFCLFYLMGKYGAEHFAINLEF